MTRCRFRVSLAICVAITLSAGALAPRGAGATDARHLGAGRPFEIEVVSGPADSVSGGDALIRIARPAGLLANWLLVTVDDRDVSDAFRASGDGTALGLVTGLDLGESEIEVRLSLRRWVRGGWPIPRPTRRPLASTTVTNHPITGPVFSGPHIPMYCTADTVWNLGAVDEYCHVDGPTTSYAYRTTAGQFQTLADPNDLPDDVVSTTTTTGVEVPYVVRIERGTINRAVYETAILHDPSTPAPSPWDAAPGWNRRLVYTFGGGCGIGYHQGSSTGGVLNHTLLSRGYATASATFNVYQQSCNDVVSAETAMMVKERFVETNGVPDFTMGWGGSAGTMQQLLIGNAYPGIIDGVIGSIGYPDERSTTVSGHDCRWVTNAMDSLAGTALALSAEQRQAVWGFAPATLPGLPFTCFGYQFFDGVDYPYAQPQPTGPPVGGCPAPVPVADRYHPDTNPGGIRCAMADFVSNVYGVDPVTGFGRPTIPDNVGVQYGLDALNAGVLSVEQFLELNDRIGGLDVQGNRTEARSEPDLTALEIAYATGRVNLFTGGLRWTPIIETRGYGDFNADFHDRVRSYSMRERLLKYNGNADNHISWTSTRAAAPMTEERALAEMDAWLTARVELEKRRPWLDPAELTRRSRPDGIADGCVDLAGEWIVEPLTLDPDAACNQLFPYHENPRMAAGGPASNEIVKCALAEPARDGYGLEFTDEQWDRLLQIFDQGVCDWSQPGVGQVPLVGVWLRF